MLGTVGKINKIIRAYAVFGFCVAAYALYVEISMENDPDFRPMCDIREYVRCSPAFGSPYAKGFGIVSYVFGEDSVFNVPNGLVGMAFYTLSFALSFSDNYCVANAHYYLVLVSNASTVYLAFVLLFAIRELCLVCLTTYMINAGCLVCAMSKRRRLMQRSGGCDRPKVE